MSVNADGNVRVRKYLLGLEEHKGILHSLHRSSNTKAILGSVELLTYLHDLLRIFIIATGNNQVYTKVVRRVKAGLYNQSLLSGFLTL
jgi:hypothetical protein